MKQHLSILVHNRAIYSQFLKKFTLDQLNKVPDGFNNNILWNVAHSLVTQQLLIYSLSGVKPLVSESWIDSYRKGTKPEAEVTQEFVDALDAALFSTFNQLEVDLDSGVFKEFNPYTTSTKMHIDSIVTALSFVLFHDGIHIGSILALAKLV
jgi:hypothetical protein